MSGKSFTPPSLLNFTIPSCSPKRREYGNVVTLFHGKRSTLREDIARREARESSLLEIGLNSQRNREQEEVNGRGKIASRGDNSENAKKKKDESGEPEESGTKERSRRGTSKRFRSVQRTPSRVKYARIIFNLADALPRVRDQPRLAGSPTRSAAGRD